MRTEKETCVYIEHQILECLDKEQCLPKHGLELGVDETTIKDWRKTRREVECHSLSLEGEDALKKVRHQKGRSLNCQITYCGYVLQRKT